MLPKDLRTDFDSLRPGASTGSGATRRTALKAALGAGYAAAALPITAQTVIVTSLDGLAAGRTSYPVGGFDVPAYHAAPAGKTGLPVILVVQEIFGVHAYIEDVCRRFARRGYLAVAPELYARQGDARGYTDIPRLMADIVSKVPDAQVLGDLDGALAWAAANGGDVSRAGITGFCWGGRIAWLYAAHRPTLKAAAAWYGRLVGEHTALTPQQPVDIGAGLRVPVLGLYGGADSGIPLDTVERMRAEIGASGSEIVIYADAPHAFFADYRASYRESAATDAWHRMLEWFRRHGVA